MRRKSKRLIALTVSFVACLILGAACGGDTAEINGFDVRKTLTVDYGETVVIETPFVTDSNGWVLENWAMVTDDEGNYVYTENGRFCANDSDGYVITYVVQDKNENVFEKKTQVIVNGSIDDIVTIDAEYTQNVETGQNLQINATCSDETAELQYTVTKKSDGSSVKMDGNAFCLTQAGAYSVSIADSDGRAEYEYTLFAQNPAKEGEVEIFDKAWEERQKLTGSKRRTWKVITTEECGILDPYGQSASYATFTTNQTYVSMYLLMRQSKEYYEQLAKEGYTTVSMWIYMDGQKNHKTVSDRDPLGGSFYRKNGPTLVPGQWKQHTMNLVDSAAAYNRSFVSCYDYYQNENFRYLLVDNSWDWNAAGGGDEMTFYITDVYATKPQTITASADAETQKAVAEQIELAPLFSADCELEYSVTYRGERLGVQTPAYTFTGNGDYTVTAVPKLRNLRGNSSITFNVTDTCVLNTTPQIKERTEEQIQVSLSDLKMQFAEVDGVTPQLTDSKVYYNGKEVVTSKNTFTAQKDGCYVVEAKGEYTVGKSAYVTYQTTTVDVWSAKNKYAFIDGANLLYTSIYTDWDPDPTGGYQTYTVDGRTETMVRSNGKGQSNSVYGKPLYSKHYYQELLKEKPNAELVMDIYIKASGGSSEYVRGLFTAYKTSTTVKNNAWQRYTIGLQKCIDEYDTVSTTYEKYKALQNKGVRPAQSSNATGALMLIFGEKSYARDVYMQIGVSEEAASATATLKGGAAFALGQDNKLSEMLDIRLNEKPAKILNAEVQFNGAWVRLSNGLFTPVWENKYLFRINAMCDGLYKVFETELRVGEDDFLYTSDEQTYTLIGNDDFNFNTLTDAEYTFDFEVYTNGGYKTKVIGVETDGNRIKGESLENGSYTVNVYAVNGEGTLSRILYYTFALDYFKEEGALTWSKDLTAANYKTVLQRYHYSTANSSLSSAISLTESIPQGGVEGTYVKYAQNVKSEDIVLAIKPAYNQAHYQSLIDNVLKSYYVAFDVYLENQDPTWTKTSLQTKVWNGSGSFSSSGSVKVGQWQTIKVDLQYYLKKWGDFRTFGLNFLNNGYYDNNQRVNFYLGNIRLEEADKEMVWSYADDASTVKLYSYSTEKNNNRVSTTTDIPEGGTAGSYFLITQKDGVEEYRIRVKPAYDKAYYETLLADTTKKYTVAFDIYVQRASGTQYLDEWKSATSFGRVSTSVARNTWLTRSYDLATLMNNWDDNGVMLIGWTTASSQNPKTNVYVGNFRLTEETK
ncbi:MAG: hypothetical protein J6A63_05565 [Clostridia bacterium]|nr:hypothetical protein [Clostridia bacterium]